MTGLLLTVVLAVSSPVELARESLLLPNGGVAVEAQVGGTAENPCIWTRWNFAALIGYGAVQGTDIGTTSFGLGAGKITEANPILRPFLDDPAWVLPGVKMTLAGLSAYALGRLSCHHPQLGGWATVGLSVLQGYVTVHNSRLLREP